MAFAYTHGEGGNPGAPPDRRGAVGCTRFSVFSAGSPQGDGAGECRDAKSHAGLQGATWMLGPILMLVSLATSLICLSWNHDRQTTRCLGPAFLPPALLGAEMSTCAVVHAPPRECSRLSRQYLQTACCVPGLLRGCSSSFLWPFILEWIIFVFRFLLYLLEGSTFCFCLWLS